MSFSSERLMCPEKAHIDITLISPSSGQESRSSSLQSPAVWRENVNNHIPIKRIKRCSNGDTGTSMIGSGGMTVLYSDPEPVLDVHGLGGNAFDTFAWEDGHM
ncbi:hypothetical protein GGR53DRAFT_467642 [Hypoxylon sp. FL1150]|nr:hypothetical protein GGR53DRAFT_467642 [Hypoxylon sp. FL1150]